MRYVSCDSDLLVLQYYDLPNLTIGAYDYELDSDEQPLPVSATLRQYMTAILNPSDASYVFDGTTKTSTSMLLSG